jgi:hypothetical protein
MITYDGMYRSICPTHLRKSVSSVGHSEVAATRLYTVTSLIRCQEQGEYSEIIALVCIGRRTPSSVVLCCVENHDTT